MIKKFQHKLLLAFGLLIVIIIALVLSSVNSTIDSVSQTRIVGDLKIAGKVYEEFARSKRKGRSEAAAAMIKTQPVLRATLGVGADSGDDLFGESGPSAAMAFEEINSRLYSAIEGLDIYQESQIFAITDEKANLLFTKTDIKHTGDNLSNLGIVRAALTGNEVATRWGSGDTDIKAFRLLPEMGAPTLFEVFIKPIAFGNEVKGLLIIGFPVSPADLAEIEVVTRAKIAFLLHGVIYGYGDGIPASLPATIQEKGEAVNEFQIGDETFIALVAKLADSIGDSKVTAIIYRSKSEELSFYSSLKDNLNIIGLLAVLVALFLAILISGRVTGSIRALIKGVTEIRAGNLDYQVYVRGNDELNQLAQNFNLMTKDLKEKEHIKNTFKRYVNPRIVNSLLEDESKLKLGGDKRNLIIYFADIAGFTSLSEKLPPERTIEFLNDYLSKVAVLIEGSEGIIDKYIGDAVMAYWLPAENGVSYERLVCDVALKHLKIAEAIKAELSEKYGDVKFNVRIGIHKGEVIIGNIGSTERMDYTIIGDNVNLASRLESLNKQYGTSIMLSDEIAKNVKQDVILRELDLVKVVGKEKPILVYELVHEGRSQSTFQEFSDAIALYRRGDFDRALELFENIANEDPVAAKFAERCRYLKKNAPMNWDGVFQALEK